MDEIETPLRKLRLALGFSLTQVGEAVGLSHSQISRLETGESSTTPEVAEKLVRFFGTPWFTEMHVLYPRRFVRGAAASPVPPTPPIPTPEPAAASAPNR